VYVFHKSLKEIEEFYSKLRERIDQNPVIHELINEILQRDSIRYSRGEVSADHQLGQPGDKLNDSVIMNNIAMYQDLDILRSQITDSLYLVLNDPYYHCKLTYTFFNSHQLFQIMPLVQKFRNINQLSKLYEGTGGGEDERPRSLYEEELKVGTYGTEEQDLIL
jgi:hypothetical protein